jgi:hypothetical protein
MNPRCPQTRVKAKMGIGLGNSKNLVVIEIKENIVQNTSNNETCVPRRQD